MSEDRLTNSAISRRFRGIALTVSTEIEWSITIDDMKGGWELAGHIRIGDSFDALESVQPIYLDEFVSIEQCVVDAAIRAKNDLRGQLTRIKASIESILAELG